MNNSAQGRGKRLLLAGVWTLGCWVNAPSAAAQPTPAPGPKFEVASIRPGCAAANGRSPDGRGGMAIPATGPGRLSTCRFLVSPHPLTGPQDGVIQEAYGKYANG